MKRWNTGLFLLGLTIFATGAARAQKSSPAVTRDADHDGVPDMRDRCPGTRAGLAVDASGCPTGAAAAPAAPALPAATVMVSATPVGQAAVSPAPAARTRSGIGAAVTSSYGALLLPILTRRGLSVEPELSWVHSSADFVDNQGGGTDKQAVTVLRVGVGVMGQLAWVGPVRLYAGPRVGLVHTRVRDDPAAGTATSTASTSWYGALALGGECFVMPRASIGGEVGVQYERSSQEVAFFTVKTTDIALSGRLAARWYFRSGHDEAPR